MTLALVRHARAGERGTWEGDDRLRPLDEKGRRQAADLVGVLKNLPITRIMSSPARRCVQTVGPLALARGLPVVEDESLWEANAAAAVEVALALASTDVVVCSHGDTIPAILDHLVTYQGLDLGGRLACKKGSTWVLESHSGLFVSARYLPPPT